MLPVLLLAGACSDLNPYDRSKYEKSDEPVSETTNQKMASEMNAAPEVDPNKPFAKQEEIDDWGASTPR